MKVQTERGAGKTNYEIIQMSRVYACINYNSSSLRRAINMLFVVVIEQYRRWSIVCRLECLEPPRARRTRRGLLRSRADNSISTKPRLPVRLAPPRAVTTNGLSGESRRTRRVGEGSRIRTTTCYPGERLNEMLLKQNMSNCTRVRRGHGDVYKERRLTV